MRKVVLTALTAGLALAVLFGAQALNAGHGKSRFKADELNGYQEVRARPASRRRGPARSRPSSTRTPGRSTGT